MFLLKKGLTNSNLRILSNRFQKRNHVGRFELKQVMISGACEVSPSRVGLELGGGGMGDWIMPLSIWRF